LVLQQINGKSGEQVTTTLLKKLETLNVVEIEKEYIPYLADLFKSNVINVTDLQSALSKYFINLNDTVIDVPLLSEHLSKLLFELIDNNIISGSDLIFMDVQKKTDGNEDDLPMIDELFRLVANLLVLLYEKKFKSWK
jgi:hypothetical protein